MNEDFKTLATQTHKLWLAAERQVELIEKNGKPDDGMQQMVNELFEQSYTTLNDINVKLRNRLAPEQVDADMEFKAALHKKLTDWQNELETVQAEQIARAVIDSKEGTKSEEYIKLEAREKELTAMIREAEEKLGKVNERVQSPAFNGIVNKIVNNAKP